MKTRIKICGITNEADAAAAVAFGADALGFIFHHKSPRFVNIGRAAEIARSVPAGVAFVGVFVDEPIAEIVNAVKKVPLSAVQLHGNESPGFTAALKAKLRLVPVIKAFRVGGASAFDVAKLSNYNADAFLLDTYKEGEPGGTGETFDWDIAVEAKQYGPIILAGGLGPKNIVEAITRVKPYGVDSSSLLEICPGTKDHAKVKDLIDRIRNYDETSR